MSIISVLREECIKIGSGASNKHEILRCIAALAKKSDILDKVEEETIFEGLQRREEIASTGFENGVAIPHCFIEGIEDFVVGILIEPEGVDFDSIDEEKAKILVFIVGPESERNRHIKYLSNISHTLRIPEVCQELISAKHPTAVSEDFLRHASVETISRPDDATCLCYVFVQKEEKFEPVLEILQATDVRGISIIEANDANHYLQKMPLFASIMNDRAKGFNRIIISIISKELVNEVIRQIDLEAGGLEGDDGITVVVQENSFIYGSMIV